MEHIRKVAVCFILALVLCFAWFPNADAALLQYRLGDTIQDFTFTTYDGQVISLYDVLKEKDAVLINIWASWCGPCRYEFPFMEEAYQLYKDDVEIIALSCEPSDSNAALGKFASEYGLTFKIGKDPLNFLAALGVNSVPTSLLIDRNGTICFIQSGAQPDAASFMRLFSVYLGEDYSESVVLQAIPPAKPAFEGASDIELTDAIEASASSPSGYAWPMLVDTVDGRKTVVSSNGGFHSSTSAVNVDVQAQAGDAIVITFKVSSESVADLFTIAVNGKTVKAFGGQHEWTTFAIPVFQDGSYTLTLAYAKDSAEHRNSDAVWIDNVKVVSGADAKAALNANPNYVVSDTTELALINSGAKEITISDERGILAANFGDARYYIVNDDTAHFQATLDEDCDPERAFFFSNFDGRIIPVYESGYQAVAGVDSIESTGYTFTCMFLYTKMHETQGIPCVVYFKDEANLNYFVSANKLGTWTYVSDGETDKPERSVKEENAAYMIRCIDQFGEPVQGVMLQVCDEELCQVYFTDEHGECEFVPTSFPCEVHVLRAPEGYATDSNESVQVPASGGDILFTFTNSH